MFRGQTEAAIRYAKGGSQVPTLLVGCRLEPAGDAAVDLTTERGYAGISLVDCVIALPPGGAVVKTKKPENLFLENTFVRGADCVHSGGSKLPAPDRWTRIDRYSSHTAQGVNLLNGVVSTGEIVQWTAAEAEPDFAGDPQPALLAGPVVRGRGRGERPRLRRQGRRRDRRHGRLREGHRRARQGLRAARRLPRSPGRSA